MLLRLNTMALLLGLSLSASACGYSILGEEYRIAILNPYLIGDDYATFFYSSERFKHWKMEKNGSDRLRNVDLWARELGNGVSGKDVAAILYGSGLDDWEAAQKSPNSNSFGGNPAWEAIRKRPALLEYTLYAKGYETESADTDYWGNPATPDANKSANRKNFRARAEAGYAKAKDGSFLKERYAYQLLLLAYYRQDSEAMERFFSAHFKDQSGPLADWARFHFAGEWNEEGRYFVEMANAFRSVPEKAFAAYQRATNEDGPFNPDAYLAAAKTDTERSNLYALAAVKRQGYALEYLEEAYKLDPANPLIKLLLVREINKLEDWLMTYELTYFNPSVPSKDNPDGSWAFDSYEEWQKVAGKVRRDNYNRDRKHLTKLRKFLSTYRPENQAFVNLLRAQTALLDEDFQSALDFLARLDNADTTYQHQVATIRFLATLQLQKIRPSQRAKLIADNLQELEAPYDEYDNKRAVPSRLAAQVYAALGDTVTAYLLYNRSMSLPAGSGWASREYQMLDYLDRPVSNATLQRILGILDGGPPENEAQKMLIASGKDYLPSVPALRNLAGTLALRRNDLTAAVAHFEKIPGPEKGERFFYLGREYSPLSDIVGKKIRLTSKADVVRQMQAMESVAGTNGDAAAAACLTLATAWYNMGYAGESWWMLSFGQSVSRPERAYDWPFSGYHRATPHAEVDYNLIYRNSRAEEYLACAEANVQDPELAARIAFLQTTIKKDLMSLDLELNGSWDTRERDEETRIEKTNQYLRAFINRHRNTEYYEELRSTCLVIGELD